MSDLIAASFFFLFFLCVFLHNGMNLLSIQAVKEDYSSSDSIVVLMVAVMLMAGSMIVMSVEMV